MAPAGWTTTYIPSRSTTLYNLSFGFSALIAASVSISALQNSRFELESDQLYRQAKIDPYSAIFSLFFQRIMTKIIPSEALLRLTVYSNPRANKTAHTVSHTVDPQAMPAIDSDRFWEIISVISACYGVRSRSSGYSRIGENYSHSIVPGGLLVTS